MTNWGGFCFFVRAKTKFSSHKVQSLPSFMVLIQFKLVLNRFHGHDANVMGS